MNISEGKFSITHDFDYERTFQNWDDYKKTKKMILNSNQNKILGHDEIFYMIPGSYFGCTLDMTCTLLKISYRI